MRKAILFFLFLTFSAVVFPQSYYWQQRVNYSISVTLDDVENALTGFEKIEYTNNSPDTLRFIWFHIWPNAYKNDRTAFSDQELQDGDTKFYFSTENQKGYVNTLNFKVAGVNAIIEDHPQQQDIVRLILPSPLLPGSTVKIETPFHVKLPYNFSRGGHVGQSYQITQWYPKPAVYDKTGWHEMPYLDRGEFYSEFGDYSVQVKLPAGYLVASTGVQTSSSAESGMKIFEYQQRNVHDFAWFADKDFIVKADTLQVGNKTINIKVFHFADEKGIWTNSLEYVKKSLRSKSQWLGQYPFETMTVVENSSNVGGGMEYPTITLLKSGGSAASLEKVINHETGHNWFYGILATNERDHPWMDEGMNSYYDARYAETTAAPAPLKETFFTNRLPADFEAVLLETNIKIHRSQPINTSSENFSSLNYNLVAYKKTAQWMKLIEDELGLTLFDRMMQDYYETWKFRHPQPEDFFAILKKYSNNADSLVALLDSKSSFQPSVKKQLRPVSFFSLKETDKYNYIGIAPAVGANYYDKLMLGLLIHNYSLPPSNFQFLLAPLYATGTKKLNGEARMEYTFYQREKGAKLILAVAGAKFTGDVFIDSINNEIPLQFKKIVPSFKYVFARNGALSHTRKYIQLKSFLIEETEVRFRRDPVSNVDYLQYPRKQRYVNRLDFGIENDRVLYPYDALLSTDQGDEFVRTTFTGNYFFNYAGGGGLNVRLFAGKFFYTTDKTFLSEFRTDRYQLNLTGPKGYEDYTYSNYFIGRNEFDGVSNQQIMQRDGFFKVKTDLLSSKVGKTDDWLAALNFTSDFPKAINPLSLLPLKIPLKIFFDIGTYAEAFDRNNNAGKFLYDAGFQISLPGNFINIYIPVIYSKVYGDYFKSTIPEKRFLKNISFSIDIQNLKTSKVSSLIGL